MKNKALLTIFVLALTTSPSALTQDANNTHAQEAPSTVKKLSRAEIDNLLANPSSVLFIDVRRPDEISSIGGFPVYLSIQIKELDKHLNEIPKDRPIVTVSNHAGRAAKAAELLAKSGFNVLGAAGAQTYEADGGHLAKIAVPPPATPNTKK